MVPNGTQQPNQAMKRRTGPLEARQARTKAGCAPLPVVRHGHGHPVFFLGCWQLANRLEPKKGQNPEARKILKIVADRPKKVLYPH